MSWRRVALFDLPLDIGATPEDALGALASGAVRVSYLNPYAWQVAGKRAPYRADLQSMSLVLCDGILVQKAAASVHGERTPLVSLDYSGIGQRMLAQWAASGATLCLVGARQGVVEAARARIALDYPGLDIVAVFSGYGDSTAAARAFILQARPQVVMVGMGMGRQEAFLRELDDAGWRGAGVCVGAFFDRLANPRLDYPEWAVRHKLRFLANITRRPVYYARRYGVDYLPFYRRYLGHLAGRKRRVRD